MILLYIVLNSIGWMVVHLSIAAIFLYLPPGVFSCESTLWHVSRREFYWYRNVLRIRRWKGRLPDGATWLGKSSGGTRPVSRSLRYFDQLIVDSKRGEAAHWLMFACCPIFFVWNPHAVWLILVLYAACANLPCIAAQRYNRYFAQRILEVLSKADADG